MSNPCIVTVAITGSLPRKQHNPTKIGVKPEIEIFDLSHLHGARRLADLGLIDNRPHIQFVMGVQHALPAEERLLDVVWNEIDGGALETVLEKYLPMTPGVFVYFPSRSQAMQKRSPSSTICGRPGVFERTMPKRAVG